MTLSCTIVDYGSGNLFSVTEALKRCNVTPVLSSDPDVVANSDRLILPGVGAFGRAADQLRKTGLDAAVLRYLDRERPFLGICVGMQILMETGEEYGIHQGLGVFSGSVSKITAQHDDGRPVRVPVIGWNTPREAFTGSFAGTPFSAVGANAAYYFVHSYAVQCKTEGVVTAVTDVGTTQVTAAIARDHVYGVQFHPERSGLDGQSFLDGFLRL
ncbi:imidazole glycerol phosphate synthase subunit HisH [Rhodophyticola sp. CCM32]|uniref:imidazole glycerol phosphate synthase subunit HisH n=1 Tax=Rhodophyticola sp. CCM32 TaxID=2916397 RepID=UPI00143DC4BE|nr:imidazole glycerol phosphate synthase subunit HisH [Rhodophyticola sp. CCM32]